MTTQMLLLVVVVGCLFVCLFVCLLLLLFMRPMLMFMSMLMVMMTASHEIMKLEPLKQFRSSGIKHGTWPGGQFAMHQNLNFCRLYHHLAVGPKHQVLF